MKIKDKAIWDYNINQKILKNPKVLKWYLERKIRMADWEGLDKNLLLKNLSILDIPLNKKKAIKLYFQE